MLRRLAWICTRVAGKENVLVPLRWAASLSRRFADFAHLTLFRAQWGIPPTPEWHDQNTTMYSLWTRLQQPFLAERGTVSVLAIPEAAQVLDLCCGDGYYTHMFHSGRAERVIAVDFDPIAIGFARRYHSAPNITYKVCDVRTEMPAGSFDTVIWNGAIEHFTETEMSTIFNSIRARLKTGGIVTGYTVAAHETGELQLSHHEYEFPSTKALADLLSKYFSRVKVFESVWPAQTAPGGTLRHNLYFYAGDSTLPFDNAWPRQTNVNR